MVGVGLEGTKKKPDLNCRILWGLQRPGRCLRRRQTTQRSSDESAKTSNDMKKNKKKRLQKSRREPSSIPTTEVDLNDKKGRNKNETKKPKTGATTKGRIRALLPVSGQAV